jgi:hypothetical protein
VEKDVAELLAKVYSHKEAVNVTAITEIWEAYKFVANVDSLLLGECIHCTYFINLLRTLWTKQIFRGLG